MKKKSNVGKILLVILLISTFVYVGIELSMQYFRVGETIATLGIIVSIAFIMIIFGREKKSSRWIKDNRERMWHQQNLTEEAFRQKYCK